MQKWLIVGGLTLVAGYICFTPTFISLHWHSASPEARGKMVSSLLRRHNLVGNNSEQIVFLLGDPSTYGSDQWTTRYELGSYFLDSWWLYLAWGDQGLVSRVYIDHD
jgi:hypothetical protein